MDKKKATEHYPDIVKVGDPVLHEPASKVDVNQIGSENIQSIIDQMIQTMRNAPGVGLAAPQIGVPLKVNAFLISKISLLPDLLCSSLFILQFVILFFCT